MDYEVDFEYYRVSKKQIDEFLVQINETIKGVTYSLDKQLVKDGIDAIFNEAKNA